MSRISFENEPRQMSQGDGRGEPWGGRERSRGGISPGWLLAGLVVLGVGFLAWRYLGPDLRRYLKIRNM